MNENNKLKTISNLFETSEIRSVWNSDENDYYFSVVDVIEALTGSTNPNDYWYRLKRRMTEEEKSELSTKCRQLKLESSDGKFYLTDTLNTKGIFRLIESVPSPKAEPFKMWLASLGSERIDEVFDPELAIIRAVNYYKHQGFTDEWIEARLKGIISRNKLTDVWKSGGITEGYEYAMLTNEIYESWSGMKASEYKEFKGLRKESLRDNMTDPQILLTDIGEITTRELAKKKKATGFDENLKVAKLGGKVADNTRRDIESLIEEPIVNSSNNLNYEYDDKNKISY